MKKAGSLPEWTFLSNHGHALIQISRNPDLKVTELASLIGITERSTLSIISDLEEDGYIHQVDPLMSVRLLS